MSICQRLVRDVLYPLALWRAGESVQLQYLREFERTQYLPADSLRALQLRRLQSVIDHAYRRCPFYRERLDSAGLIPSDIRTLADLEALPPLEKAEIQQHRDRMLAQGWPAEDLVPNQTGGSTGTPVSFFLTRERAQSRYAATLRHNRWAGWDLGHKVALLWGAPRDVPRRGWRRFLRNRVLERQLFLDTGSVTEAKLDGFHLALKRFRPRVILAYARSAVMFARYLRSRGLTAYQPHSIVTSAEVLEAADRSLLEDVFGCPVFNRYGSREVSVIASECERHQGLHTMAEGLIVEVVGREGPAAPGEMGSILVTDLLNPAMPLIRYRIGDLGAWETGTCDCGRELPRLKQVAGRVTDFVVGCDGRLVSGVFLATYLVAQRPSLGQVQILQDRAGQVLYRIRRSERFQPDTDLAYLQATSRRYLGEDQIVDWEFVDALPVEASGKFLFCQSKAAPDYCRDTAATGSV